MIGPDHRTHFILYVFYGVHDRGWQEVDVILAWNCVVIYVLCEALYCHAGKFQVRYFARNVWLSYVHEPRRDEQNLLPFKTITWVS